MFLSIYFCTRVRSYMIIIPRKKGRHGHLLRNFLVQIHLKFLFWALCDQNGANMLQHKAKQRYSNFVFSTTRTQWTWQSQFHKIHNIHTWRCTAGIVTNLGVQISKFKSSNLKAPKTWKNYTPPDHCETPKRKNKKRWGPFRMYQQIWNWEIKFIKSTVY